MDSWSLSSIESAPFVCSIYDVYFSTYCPNQGAVVEC